MKVDKYLKHMFVVMSSYRNDTFLCDTVLTTDDRDLYAHSVILAAASSAFKTAFAKIGASRSRCRYAVQLTGFKSSTVEVALRFMYTGHLQVPQTYAHPNELSHLLSSLEQLGLDLQLLNGCPMSFIRSELISF